MEHSHSYSQVNPLPDVIVCTLSLCRMDDLQHITLLPCFLVSFLTSHIYVHIVHVIKHMFSCYNDASFSNPMNMGLGNDMVFR